MNNRSRHILNPSQICHRKKALINKYIFIIILSALTLVLTGYIGAQEQNTADRDYQRTVSEIERVRLLMGAGDYNGAAAYLEVLNFRRTASRDRLYFSDELLAYLAEERLADLVETNGRLVALRECVKQLGRPQQELLEQAYSTEESIRLVAERLGQAVQTIYNRLSRIRRILFDCVERRLAKETS